MGIEDCVLLYGLLCIMDYYGLLWIIMDYYELLWIIMDYYGLLWIIMDLYIHKGLKSKRHHK